jgi:valyl-tRNA synthetase
MRFMMTKLSDLDLGTADVNFASDNLIVGDTASTLGICDKYILNCLNECCKKCNTAFRTYNFSQGTSSIYDFFVKEFCDVYIELTKRLFKSTAEAHEERHERHVTMKVLWTCMENAMRLMHPFMPFLTEELWQRMPGRNVIKKQPKSLMLCKYPIAKSGMCLPFNVGDAFTYVPITSKVFFCSQKKTSKL